MIAPECSIMSCCVAHLKRFVRLIRTVVESIASGVCRDTSSPILTQESVFVLGIAILVTEIGVQLIRHVQTLRKAITKLLIHHTKQGVVTFGHIHMHFAIFAKDWILIRPVVTISCTIAYQRFIINTPETKSSIRSLHVLELHFPQWMLD